MNDFRFRPRPTPRRATPRLLSGAIARRVALTVLCLGATTPSLAADKWDPRTLPVPALHAIHSVKPERYTLPNGAVVFLLENHELPVVTGTAYFAMGPAVIPDNRVGLASVTGDVMRSGGSKAHPGDALDDRLAAIGASVGTGLGADDASGDFRCLSDNTAEVIGLFAEVLRRPAFPDEKIELAKVGLRRAIASRNDEMLPMLQRVAREAVYGKGNPYARKLEYATVEPIQATDCQQLHHKVFVPNRMVLAIYGDFDSAQMKKILSTQFEDWAKSDTPAPTPGPEPTRSASRLVFAPKDDVTQTGILLSEPGSRADDPDYASIQVLEQALGGGFQSRLFNVIRTQRGLAYAAGASAGTDYKRPGIFFAYALTRGDSTMTTLDLLRGEVRKVTEVLFTDAELAAAKQSVQNGFVFNFEEPAQVLFRTAFYEAADYPADFLDRYQQALGTVDGATVLAAAKRKIHPDQQVAVVVGKESDFDRKLESAGLPVERVDIRIPPPASSMAAVAAVAATPEALARGKAMLKKATDLAGGSSAWAGVKTAVIESDATITMQGQSLSLTGSQTWAFPDRQLVVQKLPMGEMRQGTDKSGGWSSMMGQIQDNPKGPEQLRKDYEHSLFRVFGAADRLEVQALDAPVTLDGKPYAAALVKSELLPDLVLLFDADGRVAGMQYTGDSQAGPTKMTMQYADWKPEGALQFPRTMSLRMDGKPFMDGKITALKLNPPLADDVFKKPAK